MRWIKTSLLTLVSLAPLAACEPGEDQSLDVVEDASQIENGAPQPVTTPGADPGSVTIPLSSLGDSGVAGEAMLTSTPEAVQMMIRLTGLSEGSHAGHIHTGTCASIGSVVAPLPEVAADQSGSGTSTGTITDIPPDSVFSGSHAIVYHGTADQPGQPVACGEIPEKR